MRANLATVSIGLASIASLSDNVITLAHCLKEDRLSFEGSNTRILLELSATVLIKKKTSTRRHLFLTDPCEAQRFDQGR